MTTQEKKARVIEIMEIIENHSHELDEKEYCQLRNELNCLDNQIEAEENLDKNMPGVVKLNGAWPGGKHPMNTII